MTLLVGILALTGTAGVLSFKLVRNGEASEEHAHNGALSEAPKTVITSEPAPGECRALRVDAAIPYWDQDRAVESLRDNVGTIDSVTLFWYFVRSNGSVAKYEYANIDNALLDVARANGVSTFVLIANLPGAPEPEGDWDGRRVQRNIGSSRDRERHVGEIVALVEKLGVDGVNIDYEGLETDQTQDFTAFIRSLAAALHARNKQVAISVFLPHSGDDGNHGQDLAALSESADELVLMAYDEHYDGSKPGPVASLDWVAEGLQGAFATGVPREKAMLGIPFYGYAWPKDGDGKARDLVYEDVAELVSEGATVRFDEKAASPSLDTKESAVWFENARSSEAKLRLARDAGIRGAYLWRLGGEDPEVWDVLARAKGDC